MKPPTETDYLGTGFACLALNMALIGRLQEKGILTKQEVADMMDYATLILEQGGLSNPVQRAAHATLQGLLAIVESGKLPQK